MNSLEPGRAEATAASSPLPHKTNWLVFFVVLFAPTVLTVASVLLDPKGRNSAPVVALVGGATAGIVCGAMLGRRLGKRADTRLWLGILFSIIMVVVCIGMNCFGCLASGFDLNFH